MSKPLWGKDFDELTTGQRDREFARAVDMYDLDLAACRRLIDNDALYRQVITALFNMDWDTADALMRENDK